MFDSDIFNFYPTTKLTLFIHDIVTLLILLNK